MDLQNPMSVASTPTESTEGEDTDHATPSNNPERPRTPSMGSSAAEA
jgi:hypothetical protein